MTSFFSVGGMFKNGDVRKRPSLIPMRETLNRDGLAGFIAEGHVNEAELRGLMIILGRVSTP